MSPDLRPGGRRRLKLHSSALTAPAARPRRRLRPALLAAAMVALGLTDGYLAGTLVNQTYTVSGPGNHGLYGRYLTVVAYGQPGNGGAFVAFGRPDEDCGHQFGLELWGKPGPFANQDC